MRLYRGVSAGALSSIAVLLASSTAIAQTDVSAEASEEPAETPQDAEADPEGAAAESEVAATAAQEVETGSEEGSEERVAAASEETPQSDDAGEQMAASKAAGEDEASSDGAGAPELEMESETARVEAAGAVDAEPPAEESSSAFSYMIFGDAYATVQTAQEGSDAPDHRAYSSSVFDGADGQMKNENGFSLAFAGLDLGYEGKGWGVTTSLRFGPGVTEYYAIDPVLGGIGSVTQAYVTWSPVEQLSLDFGQFGTIFGAEVAESWNNLNYTRGALYYAMQPFWHTGLRAGIGLSDHMSLTLMLVNDANQISLAPTSDLQAAAQLGISAGDLGIALGTLQTLGTANAVVDRFFDLVVTYDSGGLSLVFNGDLNVSDVPGEAFGGSTFYGLSLAAGYEFTDMFGASVRGEFLDPNTDVQDDEILTGTVTLDTKPVPGSDNVVLRWDNRIEGTTGDAIFYDGGGDPTDVWFSSTIGLAIHTDGTF